LKRAFAGQKSVPRFRYLRRGTGKARSEIVENGHAECRKYTLRSHISSFTAENYQFSSEAKNALARKSGGRKMIKQIRPVLSFPGRYQRSTADGGKRLAAPPSADIQIIPKITQFLQTHTRWDYGADETRVREVSQPFE